MKCEKANDSAAIDLSGWGIDIEEVEKIIQANFAETLVNVLRDSPPEISFASFSEGKVGAIDLALPFGDALDEYVTWQTTISDVVDEFIHERSFDLDEGAKMVADLADHFRELTARLDAARSK